MISALVLVVVSLFSEFRT